MLYIILGDLRIIFFVYLFYVWVGLLGVFEVLSFKYIVGIYKGCLFVEVEVVREIFL